VSHKIIVDELTTYRLDKYTVRWIGSCLNDQAPRTAIGSTKSFMRQVTWSVNQG